jgi:hypothetical protein
VTNITSENFVIYWLISPNTIVAFSTKLNLRDCACFYLDGMNTDPNQILNKRIQTFYTDARPAEWIVSLVLPEETVKLNCYGALLEDIFITFYRNALRLKHEKIFNPPPPPHTHTHTADTILDIVTTHLYDLIISIICSGQFRARQFGHHPALTLKSCWYFVGFCKDVVYSHSRQKQRSFIKSAGTAVLKWTFVNVYLCWHCVGEVHSGHIEDDLKCLKITGGHTENLHQTNL